MILFRGICPEQCRILVVSLTFTQMSIIPQYYPVLKDSRPLASSGTSRNCSQIKAIVQSRRQFIFPTKTWSQLAWACHSLLFLLHKHLFKRGPPTICWLGVHPSELSDVATFLIVSFENPEWKTARSLLSPLKNIVEKSGRYEDFETYYNWGHD